jgi:glyoxylase-like metal-dependent hydrolase (beta-lactamase superfamily II)
MLKQVADGVLVHQSEFCQSNAVVVHGQDGVLLIDAGIYGSEMAGLAKDLQALGRPVVAGFSTHPHWDHLLWHTDLGPAPRYGTARCAAIIRNRMSSPDWQDSVAAMIPPDIAEQIAWDQFGLIAGLPDGTEHIPWDGPEIRVIEHQAHAPGHAALVIEGQGVLVAGDMLSDVLVPMLGLMGASDPIGDYLAALEKLESAADNVEILIPGHGSVARNDQVRARLSLDHAYVETLRNTDASEDPRIGPSATLPWVREVHEGQLARLKERDGTAG